MVDVDRDKEDFPEAEVIFSRENNSNVDASSDFFFETPSDNENNDGGISTVFSLVHLLCCC